VKDVEFHPAALKTIKKFPVEIKKEIGKAVRELQKGIKLSMPLSRAMKSVGLGVEELRIKDGSGLYRVFNFLETRREF